MKNKNQMQSRILIKRYKLIRIQINMQLINLDNLPNIFEKILSFFNN